jgi:hypothetical protein
MWGLPGYLQGNPCRAPPGTGSLRGPRPEGESSQAGRGTLDVAVGRAFACDPARSQRAGGVCGCLVDYHLATRPGGRGGVTGSCARGRALLRVVHDIVTGTILALAISSILIAVLYHVDRVQP